MNKLYLHYVIVLTATVGVTILIALYAWRRRILPGATHFTLLMLAVAEWAFCSAAEHLAIQIPTKALWSKLSYLGIVGTAPLWLLFVRDYSQRPTWLTRPRSALLWIIPLITLGLVATNEWHGLIWPTITPVSDEPGAMLIYGHGLGVGILSIYSYALLLLGTIWLIQASRRLARLYRKQAVTLLIAAVIPWVGNLIYNTGLSPWPGLELTPITFALTGAVVAWSIFRLQTLDLVPVARDILVERIADGVMVLDAYNRIIDINSAACRMFGYTSADAIGQQAEIFFAGHPALAARWQDPLETQAEVVIQSEQGPRWLELHKYLLTNQHGKLTGRLLMLHDITTRKQAEEALQQYTYELEASNAELDAFAHTVAHDLKGPISVIIGSAELLTTILETEPPERIRSTLQRIIQTGYKVASIVNELLILANVRRKEIVAPIPFDMTLVVAEVQQRLEAAIAARQAEFVAPEQWPTVLGYAPWIEEVWINYLNNALQYSGDRPRIEMGFDYVQDPYIRFWVKDNGPGLTPEQQAQLFTPFTHFHQISTGGHGLGLSIVQRIIDRLGGQVGVESQPGQGSTFWFTLPTRLPIAQKESVAEKGKNLR